MKIKLETTYSNVTEEWLNWWLDTHMARVLPKDVVKEIKEKGIGVMKSKNSSDGVIVETIYRVEH